MKAVMAEASKTTKNIPMVDGKIEVVDEELAIVENDILPTDYQGLFTYILLNCITHKSTPITAKPEGNFIWLL